MAEYGRSYYDTTATVAVAGVQTLVRRGEMLGHWLGGVSLVVQDESHHLLSGNIWGKAANMFPNAKFLGVTATPCRADGKGLGAVADGIFEKMVIGPDMRTLIGMGYLTDYRIFAPPSDLDLSNVKIGAEGDYTRPGLKKAIEKSHITGDVVKHYKRIADGKLGITFAVDVETASNIAAQFNAAGVPAEVLSAKTPDLMRHQVIQRFKNREILQLVNVDLFGEGFDLPALEVVSMARPTESFALYCLDPETEILTSEGWKTHRDLDSIDSVLSFNKNTNEIENTPITGRIKREMYKGESMYQINGPHLNFKVSDKHNMVVMGNSETCKNWQLQKAENVAQRSSLFKVPVAGFGKFKGVDLSDSELKLIGWHLTDGTINKRTNALSISQSANKKYHLEQIRETIEGCGLKYGVNVYKRKNVPKTHHDSVRYSISKGKPRGRDKHLRGWAHLEKWFDKTIPGCFDDMTREQFLIMLEAVNLGDGLNDHSSLDYVKRTLTITCGDNKIMADRLQAMCIVRGLRCNLKAVKYEGRSEWYILHIRDKQTATIAGVSVKDGKISGKKKYQRSRIEQSENKPPFVWCVSNKNETLITRREGKVIILGNCQQFGRALRIMDGKTEAIIIDHVGNVVRHGLPDVHRNWTLLARPKKRATPAEDAIPLRACTECAGVYERILKRCPYCGHIDVPAERSAPEFVDGDLMELTPEVLEQLRAAVQVGDMDANDYARHLVGHKHMPRVGIRAEVKRHEERKEKRAALRDAMAWWAGHKDAEGYTESMKYREFYHRFGVDVMTAQTLKAPEMEELTARVRSTYEV
jgi:superfamily II DNA or RNA helicase